jgi:hypothetical protein
MQAKQYASAPADEAYISSDVSLQQCYSPTLPPSNHLLHMTVSSAPPG